MHMRKLQEQAGTVDRRLELARITWRDLTYLTQAIHLLMRCMQWGTAGHALLLGSVSREQKASLDVMIYGQGTRIFVWSSGFGGGV